jgi:hypothetical protein
MSNENAEMPKAAHRRRICVLRVTGPYAGLTQIVGTTDEAPKPLPIETEPFIDVRDGARIIARMACHDNRKVIYREVVPCATPTPQSAGE